jgi:hypothetical protein
MLFVGSGVLASLATLFVPACAGRTKPSDFSDGSAPTGDSPPVCVTPPQHRPEAVACSAHSDGGEACSDAAVCQVDAGGGVRRPVGQCLHGSCSFDECLTDSDCASNEACACAGPLAGEASGSEANLCVPATCHVDSDCGSCGYCSPSADPICGPTYGAWAYACHVPGDACYSNTDCGPQSNDIYTNPFCSHSAETGAWVCGTGFCGG